jgi:hypothetical protein
LSVRIHHDEDRLGRACGGSPHLLRQRHGALVRRWQRRGRGDAETAGPRLDQRGSRIENLGGAPDGHAACRVDVLSRCSCGIKGTYLFFLRRRH